MAWVVAIALGIGLAIWPIAAVPTMFGLALLCDRWLTTEEQIEDWKTSLIVVGVGLAVFAFEYLLFLLFEWTWLGFWSFLFPDDFGGLPGDVALLGWFLVFFGLIQVFRKVVRMIRKSAA